MGASVIQCQIRKWGHLVVTHIFDHRILGIIKLMLTHDDPARTGYRYIARPLVQVGDDVIVGAGLGKCIVRECEQQNQEVDAFFHWDSFRAWSDGLPLQ